MRRWGETLQVAKQNMDKRIQARRIKRKNDLHTVNRKWDKSFESVGSIMKKLLQVISRDWENSSHTAQLFVTAVFVGVISVGVLYGIILLSTPPKDGIDILGLGKVNGDIAELFAGLAGWVAGFAGAYVAIKIASVATNIQKHDSITDFEELMEHDMGLISDLNAKLVKSSLTVRRAITANLMWYEKSLKSMQGDIFNDFGKAEKIDVLQQEVAELQNKRGELNTEAEINKHLLDSLSCFSSELESAIRNPVYWKLLNIGLGLNSSDEPKEEQDENLLVNSGFAKDIEKAIEIVDEDNEFYDFVSHYEDHTDNMMSGLNDLRVSSLDKKFGGYIRDLLRNHRGESVGSEKLTISQISWIVFGALVHRAPTDNQSQTRNEGIIFLALMFGSLPNNACLRYYFKRKIKDTEFNQQTRDILTKKMKDLESRVFFPHSPEPKLGDEITDFSRGFLKEIKKCIVYLESNQSVLLLSVADDGLSGRGETIYKFDGSNLDNEDKGKGKGKGKGDDQDDFNNEV